MLEYFFANKSFEIKQASTGCREKKRGGGPEAIFSKFAPYFGLVEPSLTNL